MSTLKDLYEYVDRAKAQLVVWRHIAVYLQNNCVSSDAVAARTELQLDDGRLIPEDIVEDVIIQIRNGHVAGLEEKMRELLDSELDVTLDKLRTENKQERQADSTPKLADKRKTKKQSATQ